MRPSDPPVRIAVNAMRARLTILGFNLAILTFQITNLTSRPIAETASPLRAPEQLPAMVALHFALVLSASAMVLFVASSRLNEDGACDSPAMLAGDMLMYLGLAHTIMGFFEPLLSDLQTRRFAAAQDGAEFRALLRAMSTSGAVGWILATYVGPIVSLVRSPFGIVRTTIIGIGYLVLMVLLAHYWALASDLRTSLEGQARPDWRVLRLLFTPLDLLGVVS